MIAESVDNGRRAQIVLASYAGTAGISGDETFLSYGPSNRLPDEKEVTFDGVTYDILSAGRSKAVPQMITLAIRRRDNAALSDNQ